MKQLKTKQVKTILTGTALVLLTACGRGDYYIETDPNGNPVEMPGQVTVIAVKSSDAESAAITAIDEKGETYTLSSAIPYTLEAGTYQVIITAPSAGTTAEEMSRLTLSGATASLTPASDGKLPAAPAFEAGTGTFIVKKNTDVKLNVPLRVVTREVVLEATLKGTDLSEVQPINISLHGVASTADLTSTFMPTTTRAETSGHYVDVPLINSSEGTLLKGKVRLLGIDTSSSQKLVITTTWPDGRHQDLTFDLTEQMAGFNNQPGIVPQRLALELTYNPQTNLSGIIRPWTPGWESDVTN